MQELKRLLGMCIGVLISLLIIYFLDVPFLQDVSYQCSLQITSAFFVTFLMLVMSFIGYNISTKISFISPPFSPSRCLRKKELVNMNEINVFEFVSDEELWTEIYGKATNKDVWKSLDVIQDQVWFE